MARTLPDNQSCNLKMTVGQDSVIFMKKINVPDIFSYSLPFGE